MAIRSNNQTGEVAKVPCVNQKLIKSDTNISQAGEFAVVSCFMSLLFTFKCWVVSDKTRNLKTSLWALSNCDGRFSQFYILKH